MAPGGGCGGRSLMSDAASMASRAADAAVLERVLLEAGDSLSRSLERAQARLAPEEYGHVLRWAAHLRVSRGLSPRTGDVYLGAVTEFMTWLRAEGVALDAVTAGVVERWQQSLFVRGGQKGRTRDLKLVAVRRFFAWREQLEGVLNPARTLQGPKREHRKAKKFSTRQLRALFAACDRTTVQGRRDYALLMFVYSTGARRAEVAALNVADLEFERRHGQVRIKGKGAKERIVPFASQVCDALAQWLADRESIRGVDPEAVFVRLERSARNYGQRLGPDGLAGIMERVATRAGLQGNARGDLGLHRLRVTFATDLYDQGIDLKTIKSLMGHSKLETTEQYVDIAERTMRTRIPSARLKQLTGEDDGEIPLWAKARLNGPAEG